VLVGQETEEGGNSSLLLSPFCLPLITAGPPPQSLQTPSQLQIEKKIPGKCSIVPGMHCVVGCTIVAGELNMYRLFS
jgi:hypothetical protein